MTKKKRIRWNFGMTVKRKTLIPLSVRDIESLSYLLPGMPLRAIPVALTQKGDPILVTIDRRGVPELTIEWRHDGPWNVILNGTPKAYLAGERCSPMRHGLPVLMKELRTLPPRHLIDRFMYNLGILDDLVAGSDPREQRALLARRIQESIESEKEFITCGDDLRFKSVWLAIADHYRSLNDIGGFMVSVQNSLGTCTIFPQWGCRCGEANEKWNRSLAFMRTHHEFLASKGDAIDVATYEAMMEVISRDQ